MASFRGCFTLLLPAVALGINDDAYLQIVWLFNQCRIGDCCGAGGGSGYKSVISMARHNGAPVNFIKGRR